MNTWTLWAGRIGAGLMWLTAAALLVGVMVCVLQGGPDRWRGVMKLGLMALTTFCYVAAWTAGRRPASTGGAAFQLLGLMLTLVWVVLMGVILQRLTLDGTIGR